MRPTRNLANTEVLSTYNSPLQLPKTSALVLLLYLNPMIFFLHLSYFTAIRQVENVKIPSRPPL